MRLVPAIALLALALGCATTAPDAIAEARAASEANLATPEGRRYDEQFAERTGPVLSSIGPSCVQRVWPSEIPDTLILYRIDAEGNPVEEHLHPQSAFGSCVLDGIRGFTLDPPPAPDYWVEIEIKIQ